MAASLALSAYGHHSKKLNEAAKGTMARAVQMHQISALGFFILTQVDTPMLPIAMLSLATALFPGVIYYQTITDTKSALGRFVPAGGMLHIGFWLVLAFYHKKVKLD